MCPALSENNCVPCSFSANVRIKPVAEIFLTNRSHVGFKIKVVKKSKNVNFLIVSMGFKTSYGICMQPLMFRQSICFSLVFLPSHSFLWICFYPPPFSLLFNIAPILSVTLIELFKFSSLTSQSTVKWEDDARICFHNSFTLKISKEIYSKYSFTSRQFYATLPVFLHRYYEGA